MTVRSQISGTPFLFVYIARLLRTRHIFKLDMRWNERLKQKISTIEYKIRNSARDRRKAGWSAQDIIDSVLEDEILGARVGKDAYYLLSSSYADYALNNGDEHETLIGMLAGNHVAEG